ncbi:MAG: hypothetical protein SFW67_12030 [Myxococcaceae bacterium]|nr:hypothetical protein [Myxococcaceae bacterium]
MRLGFALLSATLFVVLPSTSGAQTPEAAPADAAPVEATPPPPPPPVSAESTGAEGPKLADRTATPARFSRFSAGRGGPLYAFSQLVDGVVLGAFAGGGLATGGRLGSGEAFIGALAGGLLLGGAHTVVQYFHPVGLATAGTIALGTGVGALAGFGVASLGIVSSFTTSALIAVAFSQLGALVPLLALWNVEDDISGEDLALLGMTSGYGFVLTGLTLLLFGGRVSGLAAQVALLVAPAVGMALGSLWALGPDLAQGRILKLTALPLGVGLLTFLLGAVLAQGNFQLVGAATLLTTAATFGVTYFLTSDEPARSTPGGASVQPSLSLAPAGWRNEGIAVGPALTGRF